MTPNSERGLAEGLPGGHHGGTTGAPRETNGDPRVHHGGTTGAPRETSGGPREPSDTDPIGSKPVFYRSIIENPLLLSLLGEKPRCRTIQIAEKTFRGRFGGTY